MKDVDQVIAEKFKVDFERERSKFHKLTNRKIAKETGISEQIVSIVANGYHKVIEAYLEAIGFKLPK